MRLYLASTSPARLQTLRSAGIECAYRDTEAIETPLEDFTAAGPREVLVHPENLENARAVIPAG